MFYFQEIFIRIKYIITFLILLYLILNLFYIDLSSFFINVFNNQDFQETTRSSLSLIYINTFEPYSIQLQFCFYITISHTIFFILWHFIDFFRNAFTFFIVKRSCQIYFFIYLYNISITHFFFYFFYFNINIFLDKFNLTQYTNLIQFSILPSAFDMLIPPIKLYAFILILMISFILFAILFTIYIRITVLLYRIYFYIFILFFFLIIPMDISLQIYFLTSTFTILEIFLLVKLFIFFLRKAIHTKYN